MYKTWIVCIHGGGTPLYMVAAENEKRAWELVEASLYETYNKKWRLNPRKETSGLCPVTEFHADHEVCIDIHDWYSKKEH